MNNNQHSKSKQTYHTNPLKNYNKSDSIFQQSLSTTNHNNQKQQLVSKQQTSKSTKLKKVMSNIYNKISCRNQRLLDQIENLKNQNEINRGQLIHQQMLNSKNADRIQQLLRKIATKQKDIKELKDKNQLQINRIKLQNEATIILQYKIKEQLLQKLKAKQIQVKNQKIKNQQLQSKLIKLKQTEKQKDQYKFKVQQCKIKILRYQQDQAKNIKQIHQLKKRLAILQKQLKTKQKQIIDSQTKCQRLAILQKQLKTKQKQIIDSQTKYQTIMLDYQNNKKTVQSLQQKNNKFQKKQKKIQQENIGKCKACLDKKATFINIACRHINLCNECVNYQAYNKSCITCRKEGEYKPVYSSLIAEEDF